MDPNVVYEQAHSNTVVLLNGALSHRNLYIRITKDFGNVICIKLVEVDNFGFNYTCKIDRNMFDQMKSEQSLEIAFDELQTQIIDLLKDTHLEKMIEAEGAKCKVIFYEKARLKSLIFLTVDLTVTDQSEIIAEMSRNLAKLKECNRNYNFQVTGLKSALSQKERQLSATAERNALVERNIKSEMQRLENAFGSAIVTFERIVGERLARLNVRFVRLTNNLETIKAENVLKAESSVRLVNSMHHLRLENERNLALVEDLRTEVNHLSILKNSAEQRCHEGRNINHAKETELGECRAKIDELKKDLQDATMIIAQKSKTHDEIAKDLCKANTMLVNFNNQYDALSKELDQAKETISRRDHAVRESTSRGARLTEEFDNYRAQFNAEETNRLKGELHASSMKVLELDKLYKEAVKLNSILTKRLSGDVTLNHPRVLSSIPPSQRSNY